MCGSVVNVSVCVCVRGKIGQGRGRKDRARSVARLLGYCSGIRLVLIGETTENYRSEQPAARILLQTATELDLADKLVSKILPLSGLEPRRGEPRT